MTRDVLVRVVSEEAANQPGANANSLPAGSEIWRTPRGGYYWKRPESEDERTDR